ncbi:protein furry-like isoform X4, partial [Argonauta hians]
MQMAEEKKGAISGNHAILENLQQVPLSQKGAEPIITFPWSRDHSLSCYHGLDQNVKPGEYVLLTLFMEFCSITEHKIEQVLAEPLKNHFSKSLQRNEDPQFDQLLASLGCVAEQGLPSLLHSFLKWYEKQSLVDNSHLLDRYRIRSKGEKNFLCERRELAVDYVYCLVLIEILPKLSYHPGHDDLVACIINQGFRHFKYKDGLQANPNAGNIKLISSLYAEVIGVLAQSRFPPIHKTFLNELKELKLRDQTPFTAQSVISLLMGLKFFRVKMHPIEDFEMCVQFLHELGQYFLEVKDRDIKHALAMLLVEILLPVAAQAKNEVNVPVLKNFVEMLYSTTIDMTTKKKHTLHLFPLVTCLLCVSHKQFFLSNWPYFLTMCLSQLKNKEAKMSRVALESLYRLLWVYMVRIKCESNTATRSRLQSIVNSLFPKGSKMVTPRDTPLNIFVKIIQFIAKERLDFAMKEIIFDLLCVGRPIKFLTPERMSIGLRAFLVIADSLQQKDGDPPMPQSAATLPSGSTVRIKRTFLNQMLSEETAKDIGLSCYYPHILKTFDSILRALDVQVGRPLLQTNSENTGKEVEELLTSDRKPKIDLFRTCIAAIPRLIPENMTSQELVELLTRLTVHIDDELRGLAFQALQNLMHESQTFKEQVIRGFVQFIQRDVSDTASQPLDGVLRMLVQLLVQWKSSPSHQQQQSITSVPSQSASAATAAAAKLDGSNNSVGGRGDASTELIVLHDVEGLALVMLCSIQLVIRKLALLLLKEVRNIFSSCQHGPSATCANCTITAATSSATAAGTTTPPSNHHLHHHHLLNHLHQHHNVSRSSNHHHNNNHNHNNHHHHHHHPHQNLLHHHNLHHHRQNQQQQQLTKSSYGNSRTCLIDQMECLCLPVMTKMLAVLPPDEKPSVITCSNVDLNWIIDRAASTCLSGSGQDSQDMHQLMVNCSFNQPDPWIHRLVGLIASEESFKKCSHAINCAWLIVYTRLQMLFPLVDASSQTNEYRSSILRSGSKKVTNDYDLYLRLWQNYVILACCLAQQQGTVLPHHRCASPELGFSPENFQPLSSDKTENKQTAQSSSLFRLLVPLIKCESADMRDSVVNGLGYTNPAVFKELQEELLPYLKEANDKKVDNIKQRRKRNNLRVQLTRLFKLMAENGTFGLHNCGVIDTDKNCLNSMFLDYIDGARVYLEGENERDLPNIQEVRLHFSTFIRQLIQNTPLKQRNTLLSKETRHSLFHLVAVWSGQFSSSFTHVDKKLSKEEVSSELELVTVRAMSSVLTCGPVFDPIGLNEDGYVYTWLDALWNCPATENQEQILGLAKETVILLLDFNPDVQYLLDWVIDHCYTANTEVADHCLNALAAVFQTKEYSCDLIAMLNLVVLNVGSSRMETHDTAVQLLRLLDSYFFQDKPVFEESPLDASQQPPNTLNDILLTVNYGQSQVVLSDQLVKLHPDMTMPMFSEITHRFQTARPALRAVLLKCLLPWLHNIELVDPSLPSSAAMSSFMAGVQDSQTDKVTKSYLEGEGWGSAQATEMVLNNLLYITVKFGDSHPAEIEHLWAALVKYWANNLRVVVRYLVIITNMSPTVLLPYAKRVISYLGRAKPEKLVDELMNELQTVETLNQTIERTQTPPFYRLSSLKKSATNPNTTDDEKLGRTQAQENSLEKGVLHTKRHSTCEEITAEGTPCTDSTTFLCSISSMSSSSSVSSSHDLIEEHCASPTNTTVPYPLPMPAYGGYFAPVSELLPDTFVPTAGLHRSYLGVMFLSDLVLDGLDIDWTPHLPLLLHIVFLGLDHSRAIVYEHCKKIFLNLLLFRASVPEHQYIARHLISRMPRLKLLSDNRRTYATADSSSFEEDPLVCHQFPGTPRAAAELSKDPSSQPDSVEVTVDSLLCFLASKTGKPLWNYEDITPKTLTTISSSALDYFLKLVVRVFEELVPLALVEQRWSQIALQMALSCSSRHYAGRSFQILRALQVRPSTQMLSDILSRLVETAAEQGEDMQGYVTEIMLTLIASVDNLDLELRPTDMMRELFLSTPNLAKESSSEGVRGSLVSANSGPAHTRSTSYTVSVLSRLTACVAAGMPRVRSPSDVHRSCLAKSHSAQSLKNFDEASTEDKLTIVTQMFWMAVSMLESDYDYEFHLAIKLLDKILKHLQPERPECREKVDKILQQIKWTNFPGVQILLLKGCTSNTLAEPTWLLLSQLTLCINAPVMDPSGALGFPINVIALLPYLIHHYENPSPECREAADRINQMCGQQSEKLHNLATVMSLYSRGTFNKDSSQWTKCVVKYLLDVYACTSLSMITFLVEVLERGPINYQPDILQILHCIVHYVDFNTTCKKILNQQLFCPVSRHTKGIHWREALKILKLAVTRSSTLAAAFPSGGDAGTGPPGNRSSFVADTGLFRKKELPGLTLDFTVDLSNRALIGHKYLGIDLYPKDDNKNVSLLSISRKHSGNQDYESSWKKPMMSQTRTRERLISLLNYFGQRIGLPKSPSVIFSQSSDQQHSVTSSGEETSIPETPSNDALLSDTNSSDLMMTFKRFDFLDNELEKDEHNDDYFSLGDRCQSFNLHSSEISSKITFGGSPELKLQDSIEDLKGIMTSDINCLLEVSTSDEESQTPGADEDGMPRDIPSSTSSAILQNDTLIERDTSSPVLVATSSNSSPSEIDLMVFSSSTSRALSLASHSAIYFTIPPDEAWQTHLHQVLTDSSVSLTSATCLIFPRLYNEHKKCVASLTQEACSYISEHDNLQELTSKFMHILDTLFSQMECPYVFVQPESLLENTILDRHKFCVLEIQECLEMLSMRLTQAEQCLETMKSMAYMEPLNEGAASRNCSLDDQKGEMCRQLYKLLFQLVLLFESFIKVIDIFQNLTLTGQALDM